MILGFMASLILWLAPCSWASAAEKARGKGYTSHIVQSPQNLLTEETLYERTVVEDKIERFIQAGFSTRITPGLEGPILARKIYASAVCFDLDPYVFAALIAQESAFSSTAVSPTGALGLTQFTDSGIAEVNDQLGLRGAQYAVDATTAWLRQRLSNCVEMELLNGRPWIDLWERDGVREKHPGSKAWKKALGRALFEDVDTSLVYGAILLKVLVSVEAKKAPQIGIEGQYRWALFKYNGDPKAQVAYQKNIIRMAYALAGVPEPSACYSHLGVFSRRE